MGWPSVLALELLLESLGERPGAVELVGHEPRVAGSDAAALRREKAESKAKQRKAELREERQSPQDRHPFDTGTQFKTFFWTFPLHEPIKLLFPEVSLREYLFLAVERVLANIESRTDNVTFSYFYFLQKSILHLQHFPHKSENYNTLLHHH